MLKMKETDLAMIENNATVVSYFDRLKLLATSLFEWEGLDEVAGRGASKFLERVLYETGHACFVKDKELGYLVLEANLYGKRNVYDLPISIEAYSTGYPFKNYSTDECVLIFNNDLDIPTFQLVSDFAYRLYQVERITDVNLNAQRTPVLIEGDTKTALTLKNLYMQYSGNMPFIFGNKDFNIKGKINSVNTQSPYLVDKLDLHKQRLWNEVMTLLGIKNSNTDKKERLIVDEVNSNNQLVGYYLNTWLKAREVAKNEINGMFFDGEERIRVKVNDNIINGDTVEAPEEKEVAENE